VERAVGMHFDTMVNTVATITTILITTTPSTPPSPPTSRRASSHPPSRVQDEADIRVKPPRGKRGEVSIPTTLLDGHQPYTSVVK
jgi:hypothetical protein